MKKKIDEYLCLDISDCKRLGFLGPSSFRSGPVVWKRDGRRVAGVTLATDTRAVPYAILSYTINGEPVADTIYLRFKRSNLKDNSGGYYYFVCPCTGRACRKLYLVNGRFISRSAFRPLYEQQAKSKKQRDDALYKYLSLEYAAEILLNQKFRRLFYNGKLTPFGCKVEKTMKRRQVAEKRLTYIYDKPI